MSSTYVVDFLPQFPAKQQDTKRKVVEIVVFVKASSRWLSCKLCEILSSKLAALLHYIIASTTY